MEKVVAFAGHRDSWRCIGVKEKLLQTIEGLIQQGYTIFYDGNKGAFDEKCFNAIVELKEKYPYIKIVRILSHYQHNKENFFLSKAVDETIFPPIEQYYPKQRITKRNEWIVDNCDVLVCHIEMPYKSGAYKMVKYAQKKNKKIIEI